VLPIPPGTHWSDAKPIVLPGASGVEGLGTPAEGSTQRLALPDANRPRSSRRPAAKKNGAEKPPTLLRGFHFASTAQPQVAAAAAVKPERKKRPQVKNDPKYVAAARELRDRWLEHVNAGETIVLAQGKYDVSRTLSVVEGSRAIAGPAAAALPEIPCKALPQAA
jgi:hypothetical protein